ncbi:MAG: DUF4270 family protein [Flavobacteriaceae bacterium]
MRRLVLAVMAAVFILGFILSCEKDPVSLGDGVIAGEPFETGKATYDVFAYNKNIEAVSTNKLQSYQLWNYNDPFYGRTMASINSQLLLPSPNPIFGDNSQATEDNADDDDNASTVKEEETVLEVHLYIPYLLTSEGDRDSDSDGVDDELDSDADDPNSDTDGDGLSDVREKGLGTNPLSTDTDGDGTPDDEDTETDLSDYRKAFDLDHVYGAGTKFNLKVARSTYFLRDLDPDANFEESQEYFSSQDFSGFTGEVLYDDEVEIDNLQVLDRNNDDPATEDTDESETYTKLNPGIYVELDKDFFQTNILDKEGSSELFSQINFNDFLRGINISMDASSDVMMLLDLANAKIVITYKFWDVDTNGTSDTDDDEKIEKHEDFEIRLITLNSATNAINGNAVNTLVSDDYTDQGLLDALNDTTVPASRLYVKGGAGTYSVLRLFDMDPTEADNIIAQIKANNWIINEANLVFYVDRNTLDGAGVNYEPERLYLYNADTNNPFYNINFDPVGRTPLKSFLQYDGILQKSGDKGEKYKVRITNYLNDIILRDSTNAPLGLTLTSDIRRFGISKAVLPGDTEVELPLASTTVPLGTVLYGSDVENVDLDKKLQLEIFYTKAN